MLRRFFCQLGWHWRDVSLGTWAYHYLWRCRCGHEFAEYDH